MTLDEHGYRFRMNGISLYDKEGNIVEFVRESWWTMKELEERDNYGVSQLGKYLREAFVQHAKDYVIKGYHPILSRIYNQVLCSFGIQCPHTHIKKVCPPLFDDLSQNQRIDFYRNNPHRTGECVDCGAYLIRGDFYRG